VFNVSAADAPDKAGAVAELVQRAQAGAALFAGDDLNDEPVFAAAPAHWLTLKVGHNAAPTQARFCLAGPAEMALLLDRILHILSLLFERTFNSVQDLNKYRKEVTSRVAASAALPLVEQPIGDAA
jgi:trehalose-6-phosphatase